MTKEKPMRAAMGSANWEDTSSADFQSKRKNEVRKLPFEPPKRKDWTGNTICESTAMEPRNVRSGYLGWNL